MMNILEGNVLDSCREVILEDDKLKEIDVTFYNLLDGVNDVVAIKLEEAYLEYATRAIELAYIQGLEDARNNGKNSKQNKLY